MIAVRLDRYILEIVAVALAPTAAFMLFFSHRSDYAGHYIAGFGATLMLLAAYAFLSRRPLRTAVVRLVVLAIALGAMTELTIFRIAIFDPVDFFNQSIGAALAGWLLVDSPMSPRVALLTGALGSLGVVGGVALAFT